MAGFGSAMVLVKRWRTQCSLSKLGAMRIQCVSVGRLMWVCVNVEVKGRLSALFHGKGGRGCCGVEARRREVVEGLSLLFSLLLVFSVFSFGQ